MQKKILTERKSLIFIHSGEQRNFQDKKIVPNSSGTIYKIN